MGWPHATPDCTLVLGPINLAAGFVLRSVDLLLLLPCKLAAVGLPVRSDSLINSLFSIFEPRGLPRLQRSAANALRDAILLILAALSDFIVSVMRGVGVGLVLMDLIAQVVLLLVDLLLFGLSERASVGLTVVADLAIEVGFLALHLLGFSGSHLTGLNTVGDAVLLIFAALVYGRGVLRERGRASEHSGGENDSVDFHDDCLSFLLKKKHSRAKSCGRVEIRTSMFRLAAVMMLAPITFAQTAQEPEIALAAKSPSTLALYVESHQAIDWKSLRSELGLKDAEYWFAPCGGNAPGNNAPCSAEIATVANPDQTIVIIRGDGFLFIFGYPRYLQETNGDWRQAVSQDFQQS